MTETAKPDFISSQVLSARLFYLDLHPARRAGISVVCGGCERCAPEYRIDRKGFPFLSVEYVARGKGTLVLKGEPYELGPGTAFAYGPRISQRIETDAADPLVKYFVDFAGERAAKRMAESGLKPGRIVQVSQPNQVLDTFESLIENGLGNNAFTPRLCATLVELLLLKIGETAIPHGSANTRAFVSYQRCREFIEANFVELRTIEEIATQCHVDMAYLCRLFRRFDHHSPYQMLLRLKMNRAAELLQQPGMLVKQVADALNFSDPYHFSRTFKRVCGLSPEQFSRVGKR